MKTANLYLNFNGNCEEAFLFYRSVIGGEFTYLGRFGDMPVQEGCDPMPEAMKNQIMHVSLPAGDSHLMGSDVGGEWAPSFVQGNNFSVSVHAESPAEADRLFAGLSAGGMVTMPMQQTFWGDYFGMCTDKFGVNWMFSCATEEHK